MDKAKLFLIPTTLGESQAEMVIPAGVLARSRRLTHFIAENDRTARRYLKSIGTEVPLDDLQFFILNKHTPPEELAGFIKPLKSGIDMGLISEAGLPAIADPGAAIVALCHAEKIQVVPSSGPSSIILALIASGFNGQQFAFHGYLPIERKDRTHKLRIIERDARQGTTQIFMETPFRNEKLLENVFEACGGDTFLCVATDITLPSEQIHTRKIADWKKNPPKLHKRPCVFLIGVPA
jgi:16S rRNA (cytidine1402-2'-O)-methyltransferase